MVKHLDKLRVVGASSGEVNSNIHRALGCVGIVTDDAICDGDEMVDAGFKVRPSRLSAGVARLSPSGGNSNLACGS
jgi:hypothetical protein